MNEIIPNLQVSGEKFVVKQTDQVTIKPNPKITGFKLKQVNDSVIENVVSGVIEVLSKQLKDFKFKL